MALRQSRLLFLLLCCLSWFGVAHAESVESIGPPKNYVTDLAGVLSPGTQSDLNALLRSVHDQANAQVFVLTIHKIDKDEPIDQFANELYSKWKIGNAKSDKGALVLFAVDDHKYRIEVGYGLEGILPDAKTGDIGRDMVPDLKSANYDGAVRTGVNEVADVIAKDAGVTLQTERRHTYHRESQQGGGGFGLFGILFIVFILWMLFRGGRGGRGGGYGGGGGGFLQGLILGNLLGGSRGWGRGGYDGGSGWSGGDGGGGWSGGNDDGGGFSGGEGGSSGGGGASGGW